MYDEDAATAMQRRFEQDTAAWQALMECEGPHDFRPAGVHKRLPYKGVFVCTLCGGRVRLAAKQLYEQGLAHAGKSGSPE